MFCIFAKLPLLMHIVLLYSLKRHQKNKQSVIEQHRLYLWHLNKLSPCLPLVLQYFLKQVFCFFTSNIHVTAVMSMYCKKNHKWFVKWNSHRTLPFFETYFSNNGSYSADWKDLCCLSGLKGKKQTQFLFYFSIHVYKCLCSDKIMQVQSKWT